MEMMDQGSEKITIHAERANARRERIMASARRLFLINGFHATGVAQIARESGVAVGQLYRDFSCKEEIIARIVRTDCAEFLQFESLQRDIEDGHTESIWSWFADFLGPGDDASEVLLAEIVAEAGRNERIAAIFTAMREDVFGAILRALEALAPGEHLAMRRVQLANLILAMSLGLIQQRSMQPEDEIAQVAMLALEMVRAEVAAMQQPRGPKPMA
jgi:AcrR family transcriptional regulator